MRETQHDPRTRSMIQGHPESLRHSLNYPSISHANHKNKCQFQSRYIRRIFSNEAIIITYFRLVKATVQCWSSMISTQLRIPALDPNWVSTKLTALIVRGKKNPKADERGVGIDGASKAEGEYLDPNGSVAGVSAIYGWLI